MAASLEIDVLPARAAASSPTTPAADIIDIGAKPVLPGPDQAAWPDSARIHIIDFGRAFQPEIAEALAKLVEEKILASGSNDIKKIADEARIHIIDFGARLSGRGLRNAAAHAPSRPWRLRADATDPDGTKGDPLPRLTSSSSAR